MFFNTELNLDVGQTGNNEGQHNTQQPLALLNN